MIASLTWTISIIISVGYTEAVYQDFIIAKASPTTGGRDIYLIPLNDSGDITATKLVDEPSDVTSMGVIYNSLSRTIVWPSGTIINSLSLEYDKETQLADLSAGGINLAIVFDLALDTNTGNIYVIGNRDSTSGTPPRKGLIVMIDAVDGAPTEIYGISTDTYADIALDTINELMFTVIEKADAGGASYDLMRSDFTVTNTSYLKIDFQTFVCFAVDMHGQNVIWSDGSKIQKLDYFGLNSETVFYEDSLIKDVKVVGNYIYYIKTASQAITRIHRLNSSDATSIEPSNGVDYMYWLDVYISPDTETVCNRTIPNGEMAGSCGVNVGDWCNNFTCKYGFQEQDGVDAFNCTESGNWNYNVSFLCIETVCNRTIPNGELSGTCGVNVGDSCNNFTCVKGFKRKTDVYPFNCTESGTWDYNTTSLCTEIQCPVNFTTGQVSDTCGLSVGNSCENVTCANGFRKEDVVPFECTESGTWNYSLSSICIELSCTTEIPNGNLSSSCGTAPGDSCDSFNCDHGFYMKEGVHVFNCTESGTWNFNMSSLCIAMVCDHTIPNGNLTDTCGSTVGESCDNFTCAPGFKRNENVTQFSCTEDGTWDYDVSSLCLEIMCSGDIPHGALPTNCHSKAGETCDNFTCEVGFKKKEGVTGLECSESGIWSSNLSSLCVEVFCPNNITNGQVSNNCSTSINSTCDTVICDQGHTKNEDVVTLICTKNGTWDYQISFQCRSMQSAITCRVTPPANNTMSDWIDEIVTACNYTICNEKYKRTGNIDSAVCMSDASWRNYPTIVCSASYCNGGDSNAYGLQYMISFVFAIGSIMFHHFIYLLIS